MHPWASHVQYFRKYYEARGRSVVACIPEGRGHAAPLLRREGCEPIARTAYYDGIAKQWHRATGYHGGAFKRYILNDRILEKIECVEGCALLELGAGNGYFAPLMLRRFSGQAPTRLVISDQSQAQLDIARSAFGLDGAEYLLLDVQERFSFEGSSFDLILAIMLLNELTTTSLQHALHECRRVLKNEAQLIAAVPHPTFVRALAKKGVLTDFGRGLFAMPSAEGLRLPVSRRPLNAYTEALTAAGFAVSTDAVYADEKTLHEKPGLKVPRGTPLAALFDCHATSL
jgi:SAM-dependent methyltransferase